jgi:hypothetical protein
MNNVELFKHLVRLAQIAEEIEPINADAADLIDQSTEELADTLVPSTPDQDVMPEMFPKQDTPVIPYNQYETGETKEFTQNQFDNDAKIPFSDALEIAEEVTGEDPSWSQGVMENIEGNFDAGGDKIINYTNEDEVISNQTEVEKIGEEIFNEIYPMIEEGASDAEINQEIDKKILEKVDKEIK